MSLLIASNLKRNPAPFPPLGGRGLMVEQDAWRITGKVFENRTNRDPFRHHDRRGRPIANFRRGIDEQPFGRREPLMTSCYLVEESFQFDAINLALIVENDADGETSQRLFDCQTPF